MAKRLVLAGAGHAHVMLLVHMADFIQAGIDVTVIGPNALHYYSGMGPGMLGGTYSPEDISFPVKQMVEKAGGTFLIDNVVGLDPKAKQVFLEKGDPVSYDIVSFNTGSQVPQNIVEPGSQNVFSVKPIENLYEGRKLLLEIAKTRPVRVGVVGGGPGALEVAGNAYAAGLENNGKGALVRVFGGQKFLRKLPEKVRQKAFEVFTKRKIEIVEGGYAQRVSTEQVILENGKSYDQDLIFTAMGVKPRPLFQKSGVSTGQDGGLLVNKFLQNPEYPEIFGGGDCIWFQDQPLDKVGVYAVRQNPILLHNIKAALLGGDFMPFIPQGAYLLIFNLGAKRGILHKNGFIWEGWLSFWLKDYIDQSFIKRFKPVA